MNGYIQIDCKGLDLLAESAQTINGLYNEIQEAIETGKPMFATNLVWGDVSAISPVQVFSFLRIVLDDPFVAGVQCSVGRICYTDRFNLAGYCYNRRFSNY